VLILARKRWERIVIGGVVWVTVIEIEGGYVRLHIYAPKSIGIYRKEIWDLRQAGQGATAQVEAQPDGGKGAADPPPGGGATSAGESQPGEAEAHSADWPSADEQGAFYIPPHPVLDGCPGLVLRRKVNEQIIINDDVVITVVEIRRDKVRLGTDAPRRVQVHRKEVYEAMYGPPPEGEPGAGAS